MRLALLLCICLPSGYGAELSLETLDKHLDLLWMLVASVLVMFMQAGFMCIESGMAREKNGINVCVKNLSDFTFAILFFWLFGFGLMFGVSESGLLGLNLFFFSDPSETVIVFFIFQLMFCGTAATITSGALAERAYFSSYLIISIFVVSVVYPIFGHWVWSGLLDPENKGWLEQLGFYDFAGSSVVHSCGAWVALAAIIIIGPRKEKFDASGKPRKIHAHNLGLVFLGTFILFFGWFGFVCGSVGEINTTVFEIALHMILAAAAGGLGAISMAWVLSRDKKINAEMMTNGVLGGLVAISAACAVVSNFGALTIGLIAGAIVYLGINFVEQKLKLDDVVGAVSVHGFCGMWGTLSAALFNVSEQEISISVQLLGIVVCFVWAFGISFIFLKIVNKFMSLRISYEEEEIGLNVVEHGAPSAIWELAQTMHGVTHRAEGAMIKKAHVEPGTSIGNLAMVFNDMLDAIVKNEHELRAFNIDLKNKNSDLQAYDHMVAHDLKAPLRGIKFYAESMTEDMQDGLDVDVEENLQTIVKLVDRANHLIQGILAFSVAGKKDSATELCELDDCIENALLVLEGPIKDRDVEIDHQALDMSLQCYPVKLTQLFQNIIGNAIKYQEVDNKPKIVIRMQREQGKTSIVIEDNGLGIPEDKRAYIFEPFKRLHGTSSAYEGSGIGLATCKRIAELHQWAIRVDESALGGTAFIIDVAG